MKLVNSGVPQALAKGNGCSKESPSICSPSSVWKIKEVKGKSDEKVQSCKIFLGNDSHEWVKMSKIQ